MWFIFVLLLQLHNYLSEWLSGVGHDPEQGDFIADRGWKVSQHLSQARLATLPALISYQGKRRDNFYSSCRPRMTELSRRKINEI